MIALVVSDNPTAPGLRYAVDNSIATVSSSVGKGAEGRV